MRSTESMMLLPTPPTRASLRGFWGVVSLGVGAAIGVALPAALTPPMGGHAATVIALVVLIAIPGMLLPYAVADAYRAWNWLARRFSRTATSYVTAVCYWTIVSRIGGSPAAQATPGGQESRSTWTLRSTQPPETYTSPHAGALPADGNHWSLPLRAWMRSTAPPFAWTLLPFIVLIQLLNTEAAKSESASANIYTLY